MNAISESDIRRACLPAPDPLKSARGSIRSGQPPMSVAEILAELERIADLPLSRSETLPAQAYTSQEFFDWEIDNLFKNYWICLGHVSQIPNIGYFLNVEVLGEPVVVVRDKENGINVLSRVCPHRAMDIMPPGFGYDGHGPAEAKEGEPGCGHTRFLLCPYHFWTFELDGKLKACAEMGQAEGFNRDEWGLRSFCSEVWNGFVFVNLDCTATMTVAEQYATLSDQVAPWQIADMVMVAQNEWDCAFNWKILTENFMESYHHAGAHSKTLQPMMPARDTWTEEEKPFHISCHLPMKEELRAEIREIDAQGRHWETYPPIATLPENERLEWGLVLGFPLFTFVLTGDSVIWYRILPMGPDHLKLLTTILVPRSTTEDPNFEEMNQVATQAAIDFHLEDMEVCMAVQRGLFTAGYQRGRLSHLEMPIWLIQRFLAARGRGTWPTMDRPGAPSQKA